jgi:hypothetical protein
MGVTGSLSLFEDGGQSSSHVYPSLNFTKVMNTWMVQPE